MTDNKFDEPTHVWIVEYSDLGDESDANEVNEMTIFEYEDKPLTEADVLEEVRYSFTAFEENKDSTLSEIGIKIISIIREQC